MSTTTMTTTNPTSQGETSTLPELNTYPSTSTEDLIPALRLIADSVAQQRQSAARDLISHPLFASALVAVIAIVSRLLYHDSSDLPLVGTTCAGCIMAGLLVVRACTEGYIEEAERVGKWEWLVPGSAPGSTPSLGGGEEGGDVDKAGEQVVLVTRFGERVIGTLVLRGTAAAAPAGEKAVGKTKGVIRVWTVERRYRGHGVGVGLLEEAVALCKRRGWEGPEFDERHANAKRVVPALFDKREKRERWAREVLERVVRG